jgi:hypothetical protein
MSFTPIADAHSRIRSLMVALDRAAELEGAGVVCAVITDEIDTLTSFALRAAPEDAADAMLQIDVAVPALECLHDGAEGDMRHGLAVALLALASSAAALAFTSKKPLPGRDSISDLADFVCRAPTRFLQPA